MRIQDRASAPWLLAAAFTLAASVPAGAQIGTGWTQRTYTKRIHLDDEAGLQTFTWTSYKSVCSPICADYRYDSATDSETFRLLDNRTNRSEIRLQNEYSSGRHQFQGYVTFWSPLDDESLMQVFGSTTGATQMMLRGYAANGGEMRGGGATVASGVYGTEQRVNVIHQQGASIQIYINGTLKATVTDDEAVTNYWKYGCYGTLRTAEAVVRWRQVRTYEYTGSTSPTPTPTPTPTPCSGCGGGFSGYYRIMARHSGKAVVVQSASTANGANVFQWTYGGSTTNDEWELRSIGSGYYRVINRHSGKDLNVSGASTANGANVIQYSYGGTTTNDEWQPVDLGTGYVRLLNRHSGKVLNVSGASTADGANVDQWGWANVSQQQFQLISVP